MKKFKFPASKSSLSPEKADIKVKGSRTTYEIEECIGYKEAQRRGGLTLPEGGCLDAHHWTPQRHWDGPECGTHMRKAAFSALGFLSHIPPSPWFLPQGWALGPQQHTGSLPFTALEPLSWGWPKLQTPTQTPILGMSSGSFLPKCIVFLPTFLPTHKGL